MGKGSAAPMRCPYECLGVPKTASDEEIRSAYKRLALRLHPDKAGREGEEQFKAVATAYGILSDPDKRRRFDLGGYDAFNEADLAVEIDLSALGWANTAMAAVFSKLGVPIKTAVSAAVLEAAYEGRFAAAPLSFGQRVQDKVEKQAAKFYELSLSQAHIDAGFVIAAYSSSGSRFKLLLFEQQGSNDRWELVAQEDSSRMKKLSAAGLYCLPFDTYSVGPKLTTLETAADPESGLFKRLDSLKRREPLGVRPGKQIVAVFGDNYFKKVQFTLEAVLPGVTSLSAEQVRAVERELARKREELRAFEIEYRRAMSAYDEACARYEREQKGLEELLGRWEAAYLDLLGIGDSPKANGASSGGLSSQPGSGSFVANGGAANGNVSRQNSGPAAAAGGESEEGVRRMLGLTRLFSGSGTGKKG